MSIIRTGKCTKSQINYPAYHWAWEKQVTYIKHFKISNFTQPASETIPEGKGQVKLLCHEL